jgi:hypothetical protein
MANYLVFQSVHPGADRHGLYVTFPVDPVVVAAGLAQGLVEAALKLLEGSKTAFYT